MRAGRQMERGRERLWLTAILGLGLAMRLAAVLVLDLEPESDYAAYRSMALNWVQGNGIVDSMGNLAMYNVGYPLFVIGPAFALFGDGLLPVQIANALLGVAGIALCYGIAREAGAGPLGRLLAAGAWAVYLPSSVYAEYLAKENLMAPLMLGVVWCSLRALRGATPGLALACGALFGLLALTGNAALSLALPALVALAAGPGGARRKVSGFALALGAALLVASPWMLRNHAALGAPVLNTNGGFNLYLGNNPAATGYFVSISETPRGPTWEALREVGEVEASATLRREALEWIAAHPGEFAALALKKAAIFWTPPVHEGKRQVSGAETLVRNLWAVQFVLLVAAAAATALLPELRARPLGVLWLSVASYWGVHMLFYVIFRYREPIMPLLCVLAALAAEALWMRWRARTAGREAPA